ncbi:hypothetical protein HMPREF1015_02387 [Bacillus smithii 7_3_47FAA]|jgi:ACT domain-containing protein|uniref:UPF0237 protein HMPREF1015_02387 n=1 Tax=Bacillus smithii 7_3_47FAA TaxID=665952 RepID=G9QQW4_9BACI|nr:ACT domain protein [Bacillus smithii]EHL72199.1 hypothetical protein HMPREF1015_02387 [Bacillus smithii 7_3_47FAA]
MVKAILTVIGKDNIGIIAGVSQQLADLKINILDVSQTIMNGYFTMMMMLDLSKASESFETIKKALAEKGVELNVQIKIQHEDIFNSMHSL